ncbi:MAG: hypothetical protein AAF889_00005 [Cyanobacteria bacterium P01_D01_bin.73]
MATTRKTRNPKPRASKKNTATKSTAKRSPQPTKKQRTQAIANQHAVMALGAPAALVVAAATGKLPADQIVPSSIALTAGNAVGYMFRRSS